MAEILSLFLVRDGHDEHGQCYFDDNTFVLKKIISG